MSMNGVVNLRLRPLGDLMALGAMVSGALLHLDWQGEQEGIFAAVYHPQGVRLVAGHDVAALRLGHDRLWLLRARWIVFGDAGLDGECRTILRLAELAEFWLSRFACSAACFACGITPVTHLELFARLSGFISRRLWVSLLPRSFWASIRRQCRCSADLASSSGLQLRIGERNDKTSLACFCAISGAFLRCYACGHQRRSSHGVSLRGNKRSSSEINRRQCCGRQAVETSMQSCHEVWQSL